MERSLKKQSRSSRKARGPVNSFSGCAFCFVFHGVWMDHGKTVKSIVGLGNPGRQYVNSRHNTGFKVIDLLAHTLQIKLTVKRFGGILGRGRIRPDSDEEVLLLKPQGYMNRSGQVVATVIGFYRIKIENLLIVTDDMALGPGRIRARAGGSCGGHKGLADIIAKLGTERINRLRIGIGSSSLREARDYVLGKPADEQMKPLAEAIKEAAEAAVFWLHNGIEETMNRFNENKKLKEPLHDAN